MDGFLNCLEFLCGTTRLADNIMQVMSINEFGTNEMSGATVFAVSTIVTVAIATDVAQGDDGSKGLRRARRCLW